MQDQTMVIANSVVFYEHGTLPNPIHIPLGFQFFDLSTTFSQYIVYVKCVLLLVHVGFFYQA